MIISFVTQKVAESGGSGASQGAKWTILPLSFPSIFLEKIHQREVQYPAHIDITRTSYRRSLDRIPTPHCLLSVHLKRSKPPSDDSRLIQHGIGTLLLRQVHRIRSVFRPSFHLRPLGSRTFPDLHSLRNRCLSRVYFRIAALRVPAEEEAVHYQGGRERKSVLISSLPSSVLRTLVACLMQNVSKLGTTILLPALLFSEIGALSTMDNLRKCTRLLMKLGFYAGTEISSSATDWIIIPLSLLFQGIAFAVGFLSSRIGGLPQHL